MLRSSDIPPDAAANAHTRPAPLPTPPLTLRGASPSPSERCGRKTAPLFTLSPAALPPSEQTPNDEDISSIWNVVSRAADVVKDGERLENLAWRHWSDHRVRRRSSSSTCDTASSAASIQTPVELTSLRHRQSFENRRSFTNKLKLLVEEDSFKDWIEDARQHHDIVHPKVHVQVSPPRSSQPSQLTALNTPVPNLEIRLVEPTPVPSRVGSLHGSISGSGSSVIASKSGSASQPPVREEEIEEESTAKTRADAPEVHPARRKRAAKGGFFIHQSPGKVSGTSDGSSETSSSVPAAAPAPAPAPPVERKAPTPAEVRPQSEQPNGGPADSSQWRSSAESTSAVVMKKKERRHVSMATMRGRFQAEKRIATQAINARKQEEAEEEEDDDDDSDWEDEDDGDDIGLEVDNSGATKQTEGGEDEDNEDDWEDEPSSAAPSVPPSPRSGRNSKKERAAAAARLELEKEALRKRTMFAKMQIEANAAKQPTEGLLSRVFRTGKSMIDLTQAGQEDKPAFRRTPTHANFTLGTSPNPAPAMLRSKSVVAMPVQTSASVITGRSHKSGTSDDKRSHRSGTSDGRIAPDGVEMESSDEESEDDNYLESEEVRAKLEELDAKRAARHAAKAAAAAANDQIHTSESTVPVPAPVSAAAMGSAMGEYNEYGVARPISPTSRRRMIIMREMSESLRRNIILEREKSSGPPRPTGRARPPPSVHTSHRSSILNLAQLRDHTNSNGVDSSGFQRLSSNYQEMRPEGKALERHNSQPNLTAYGDTSPTIAAQGGSAHQLRQSSVSPTEQKRRHNLLGHGFLRPLTRADADTIGRTRSSATLNLGAAAGMTSPTSDHGTVSPTATTASSGITRSTSGQYPYAHLKAPPMIRSSTEGDHIDRERARKRELHRRSERTDTSYRYHGW